MYLADVNADQIDLLVLNAQFSLQSASTIDGFQVLTGRRGRSAFVGVLCPSDFLEAATSPERLRALYEQLRHPDRDFLLFPECDRESDAFQLLRETLRIGVLPHCALFPR